MNLVVPLVKQSVAKTYKPVMFFCIAEVQNTYFYICLTPDPSSIGLVGWRTAGIKGQNTLRAGQSVGELTDTQITTDTHIHTYS